MQSLLVLTQHCFARAKRLLLLCSASHRSSHSTALIWLEPKLNFRLTPFQQLRCGTRQPLAPDHLVTVAQPKGEMNWAPGIRAFCKASGKLSFVAAEERYSRGHLPEFEQ